MLAFPNVSIAMYVLWKAIEAIYRDLVKKGYVRPMPYGDLFLYTISTAYVLWQIVIEPQAIRKGYLKFLLGLTGNRLNVLAKS
ncbi:hypothetical protein TELCIR_02092 [Teladorsagia circumcincta]|uniref:Uncharacterized protein n=1 Tax=Teladorsagia circumcincta TaxID=45464 RepID=A0A2G9V0D0_TELCI|nr:hypothetical protein TELCIR_02092 [Teladorsagia circumcincta]